jgi:phosphoribosylformylglycinamidine synthase
MKFGVIVFPGSNCDADCYSVIKDVCSQEASYLWHQDTSLKGCDCVILPGGFSYGDYLRTGAVACFSPIMKSVISFARDGGIVLGICNGFQILLEAGLLPGAMVRNTSLRFICRYVNLRVEHTDSPFTNKFRQHQVVRMPIAHNEGNYIADPKAIKQIESNRQVLFRYCDSDGQLAEVSNPNGSMNHIAGLSNAAGNVMGMMPHPERCSETELGSIDGRVIFESLIESYAKV